MTNSNALDEEKILSQFQKHKLPEGKTCGKDCFNYLSWCRDVFAGEKPWPADSNTCAAGLAVECFNQDFRKPTEFVKGIRRPR